MVYKLAERTSVVITLASSKRVRRTVIDSVLVLSHAYRVTLIESHEHHNAAGGGSGGVPVPRGQHPGGQDGEVQTAAAHARLQERGDDDGQGLRETGQTTHQGRTVRCGQHLGDAGGLARARGTDQQRREKFRKHPTGLVHERIAQQSRLGAVCRSQVHRCKPGQYAIIRRITQERCLIT